MFNNQNVQDVDRRVLNTQNESYIDNNSFMHLRINTEPVLQRVENFLSGKRGQLVEDASSPVGFREEQVVYGKPLANDEGINHIMNSLYILINQHIVQGNFKEEMYWEMVAQLREELTLDFLENGDDWGIDDPLKYRYIVDKICSFLETFLTRTINNKERESYSASMVSKEVIGNEFLKKKSMLGFFGGDKNAL